MSERAATALEVIQHLDFAPQIPCEHPTHTSRPESQSGPGSLLIRRFPHCGQGPSLMIVCEGIWRHAGLRGLHCGSCGAIKTRAQSWALIERIGGAR